MNIFSTIRTASRSILAVCAVICSMLSAAYAQNSFENAVKQLSSDNARGYLQPIMNSFGANLNSGLYHSASIGDMGLSFRLDFIGMGTLIGDAEKVYTAKAPEPYDQTPVQTATVFGGEGATISHSSGMSYQFQNGQIKTSIVPFASPQLTIGTVYGTQAVIRYVPIPEVGDFPKVTLFGIGARHSISRYLPSVPVDLAAGIFYQTFKVGDLIDARALNFGGQVSKSISILTAYGGMQYETSSMDVSYTYTGPDATENNKIKLSFDGENKFRFTGGLSIDLAILHLCGDISLGKVTAVSGAVGFGL